MGQITAIIVQRKAENIEKNETRVFYCQWGIGKIMPSQLLSIFNGSLTVSWCAKDVVEKLKPQGTSDITEDVVCANQEDMLNRLDFNHPELFGEIIKNQSNDNGGIFIRFTTGGTYDIEISSVEYAYMLGKEENGDYKHFCTGEEWMEKVDPEHRYIDRKFKEMYKHTLAYYEAKDRSTGEVDTKQHQTLHFINSRHETEWGYQLPDGRIIDLLDAKGYFALKYDRAFNLQTGEVFPEGKHPDGSVTLNDLNYQGGKTVHCYDEVILNYSHRYVLSPGGLKMIQRRFAKKGYNVTKEAIQHQYDCWRWGGKSGYRDEQNGYHLFTPAGVNPFSLRLTSLHEKCSDWQKTYMG